MEHREEKKHACELSQGLQQRGSRGTIRGNDIERKCTRARGRGRRRVVRRHTGCVGELPLARAKEYLRRGPATVRRATCHDDGRPGRPAARQTRIPARKDAQYVAMRAARYRPNIARSWTRHGGGEPLTEPDTNVNTSRHDDDDNDNDEDEHEDKRTRT